MISEFQQLTAKVSELASLTQSLRQENAELRRSAAALTAENAELVRRMDEAHQRVADLLASIPVVAPDEESA
jgi:uncharacterized protein (TIGR02449 family)